MDLDKGFAHFAGRTSEGAGNPLTFCVAALLVIVWAVTGPVFHFSENWQLVINTGTTIVTFLMVFLIQNTQNRDSRAIQTKLDELILTSQAENEFVGIEKLTDQELKALQDRCADAAQAHARLAQRAGDEVEARRKRGAAPGGRRRRQPAQKRRAQAS